MQRTPPFVWIGLLVWLAATVLVRFAGHFIFNASSPALLGLFVVSLPLVWALTFPLYRRFGLEEPAQRSQAALRLAALPILLEVPSFFFHTLLFPNMGVARMAVYAAFLFYFYGLVLLTAFARR